MLYVPVIPHRPDPSPRARELADLLGKVLDEYEKYHPSLTAREVRAALEIAARRSRSATLASREAVMAGVALAMAAAGAAVLFARGGGGPGTAPVGIVLAIIVLVAVIVLARRASGG